MPTTPAELMLSVFELGLVLGGALLFLRLVADPARRQRWLTPKALPPWPVTLGEFGIFVFLIFASGMVCQMAAHGLLKGLIARSADHDGLQLCLNGFGFDGGGLLGWMLFRSMRKTWYADYGAEPPAEPPPPALSARQVTITAGYTLLAALPLLILFNLGWSFLLKKLGLPEEPQDLIAVFANTKSPFVIAGMLFVACVLAPVYEELLFRAGLYRVCRQRLGRGASLLISGCLFGAAHANWAGFVPLSILGMVLALAYEATGDIRVPIVAHGLFNLNTVLLVLSGLSN